jgi:hypothetical protein
VEEIKVTANPVPVDRRLNNNSGSSSKKGLLVFLVLIVAGILTGYLLFRWRSAGTVRLAGSDVEVVQTPTEEGVKDASTFKDTAKGTLEVNSGKLTNEGTHVLHQKPGDASQDVYLTSSVVDMSNYVGKNVQVWGETFEGQKAGWLMDVGRIKIIQ